MIVLISTLTGCSIFKKKTTVKNHSKVSVLVDSITRTTIDELAESIFIYNEQNGSFITVTADNIWISPDGDINASGNASAEQSFEIKKNVSFSDYSYKEIQNDSDYSIQYSESSKDLETISEPCTLGGIAMLVGVSIGALVLTLGVRFFKRLI